MDRRESPNNALGIGLAWAYRCMNLGLAFALPPLGGHYVDLWLGTTPWATIAGAVLGFAVGIAGLLRLVGRRAGPPGRP